MKLIYLSIVFLSLVSVCYGQPKMQATIKPGSTPRTVDIYLKPSASFSQRDEAMTFALAIPATVTNGPTLGSSGVTANSPGAVTSIAGLQPKFLVNNLNSAQREVFVSKETINGMSFYIYTFIFAGTASIPHEWTEGVEQQIFSIQFNGCSSDCVPGTEQLVNIPNGGSFGISYWYFQPNTLGDITNYEAPFYGNPNSNAPVNGSGNNGSALSTVSLKTPVSLSGETTPLVTITSTNGKADFQVYPNPIANGVANLKFLNQIKGLYTLTLLNASGQVVLTKQVAHNGGNSNHAIALNNIAKGYYILDIAGTENNKKSIKVVY